MGDERYPELQAYIDANASKHEAQLREGYMLKRRVNDDLERLRLLSQAQGPMPYVFALGEDASDYIDALTTLASFIGAHMIPLDE